MLRRLILVGGIINSLTASACTGPSVDRAQGTTTSDALPAFVGKTWISTDTSAPRGTLRIFLPDGTLMMSSCVETYRLARWQSIADGHVAWDEDGARIEAEIGQRTPDELQLALHLRDGIKQENYQLARVPYVCPDIRPSQ